MFYSPALDRNALQVSSITFSRYKNMTVKVSGFFYEVTPYLWLFLYFSVSQSVLNEFCTKKGFLKSD